MDSRAIKLTGVWIFCTVLLVGCWDRVEIDQRGFVIGIAIDEPVQSEQKQEGGAKDKIRITYQIVVPSELKAGQTQTGGKGKAYYNVTVQEKSMSSAYAKLALRTSRLPFMEHLKTIIVSSEVAQDREGLNHMFDFLLRENDMRRSAHVLIAKGEARKLLEMDIPNEPMSSIYLNVFERNRRLSSFIAPQIRIGDVQEKLLRFETFVLPEVSAKGKEEAAFDSAAIIDGRTNRMVGTLKDKEVQALNFMSDEVRGGIVNFKFEGKTTSFQLDKASRTIVLTNRDPESLSFKIKVLVDGTLNETAALDDFTDPEVIARLERSVSQVIASRCEDTADLILRKFKKDAIGLGAYLYRNHYRLWQKVENDWETGDNVLSHASVEVEVQTKMRRSGNIGKIRRG